ncbi:SKICH domain-containing protein [Caenorhabditis elegans]|uniref:SKICH domain-containing protein n=1 Tax=Caenorhabditis elegans TaxID=6239 RepID=O62359_CAEEL|nr:SKICH domain-containing protein [Caenorhabditis elegans]CAB04674.2 SKICH domain-containing protein [Caenorhabditis elegans]|eukprot:NP_493004.2 Uncharacterized protein CELE_T02G6.6 [Caenorhabditis elegans]
MSFNFTDVSNRRSQDEHYSALSKYVTNNATPILFKYDESFVSHPLTWNDGCYTRFLQITNAQYLVYWMKINTDTMYCEVYSRQSGLAPQVNPTFEQSMLLHVEMHVPRC